MGSLSSVLRTRRSELGLTLAEIAEQMGVAEATVQRWESGNIKSLRHGRVSKLAEILKVSPASLMGWDDTDKNETDRPSLPSNAIPYVRGRRLPILGRIQAGGPVLASENIEGYDYADVPEGEDYFFLRVKGDSMINAHILPGALVLIRRQPTADNGQVVVCLINGDEATLKRFYRQGDVVILQPENTAYSPIIVPNSDFESGEAQVLGVVKKVVFIP